MRFVSYGLTIDSEIFVPGVAQTDSDPQVIVRLAKMAKPAFDAGGGRAVEFKRGEFRIHWRNVGTYLIRGGCEILVDPEPAVEAALIRLFLVGPALAYLLHQRGLLVLHASVVSINGFVVGFLGEKGWGKSTTAAALNAKGHALVADDLLAIMPDPDGMPMVLPGPPQFKLWPEAAAATFGDDPEALARLHSQVEKRTRPANSGFLQEPLPLRHLYLLDRGAQLETVPMTPNEALLALVRHTYLSGFMKELGGQNDNFRQCVQLARRVSSSFLKRPQNLHAVGDIASLVEDEVSLHEPLVPLGEFAAAQ
jgi:hypothetical protein